MKNVHKQEISIAKFDMLDPNFEYGSRFVTLVLDLVKFFITEPDPCFQHRYEPRFFLNMNLNSDLFSKWIQIQVKKNICSKAINFFF